MPDRKRKVKFIYVVIAVGCSAVACVCLHLGMHGIVINYGIRFYRSLRNILFCISAVISVAVTVLYVSDTIKQRKWQNARDEEAAKAEMMRQEALREQEKHREVLSVSKKMDSEKIRGLLREYAGQKWKALAQQLMQLKLQLDMMDEHQEKLAHLLDVNGADALANTQDILDRVEQYLCKNVRKVLNYLDVADEEEEKDVRLVQEKLADCHEEGQKQLQQVQEFLFALAEFLNRQGEDDNSMEMLDIYKSTILSSIEDEQSRG
jgi:hypothetical protein